MIAAWQPGGFEYSRRRAEIICDQADSKTWPGWMVRVAVQHVHWSPDMCVIDWHRAMERLHVELGYAIGKSLYIKRSGEYRK